MINTTSIKEVDLIYKAIHEEDNNNDDLDVLLFSVKQSRNNNLLISKPKIDNFYKKTVFIFMYFLDWRAKQPMVVYLNWKLPVESLAFSYIFYNGIEGTWRPLKRSPLTLSEYCRIRSLSYDITSVDRAYIFILYCEKVSYLYNFIYYI